MLVIFQVRALLILKQTSCIDFEKYSAILRRTALLKNGRRDYQETTFSTMRKDRNLLNMFCLKGDNNFVS